ncbi:MAG: hypothetical protein ACI4PZ_01330 [Akkermansia sp.]
MNRHARRTGHPGFRALLLCLLLSLLAHALLALLLLLRQPEPGGRLPAAPKLSRHLQLRRAPTPAKGPQDLPPPTKSEERPFAKTSPDLPPQRPEQADYVGARDSRAAADPTARDRNREADIPALEGRERREDEEIVTVDQERQDGELAHEGKQETRPQQPPTPPEQPADPPEETVEEPAEEPRETAEQRSIPPPEGTLTLRPLPEELNGDLLLRDRPGEEATPEPTELPPPAQTARRARHARLYDPALSAQVQAPGFRTAERRTRSSGRFILGKGAALNVDATPRGQYEAEVYRRIARMWYAACDDHRGDIIPGSLTISLRIDRRGRLANMKLLSRRGAGISQQSFTFAAIRRAALPPMPSEVQADIVGELLELIFTFHFD